VSEIVSLRRDLTGEERVTVDERCTLCGACVNVCPQSALSIERLQASPEELARYEGFSSGRMRVREKKLVHARSSASCSPTAAGWRIGWDSPWCVALGDDRMVGSSAVPPGATLFAAARLAWGYSTDGFTRPGQRGRQGEAVGLLFGATPKAAILPAVARDCAWA